MLKKIPSLLFFLFLGLSCVFGQIPRDSILPEEALIEDLYLLKEAVLQTHQNPYTYCTVEDVENAFQEAQERLKGGQNYFDFARICGQFLQTFKDSHSSLNFAAMMSYIDKMDGHLLNIRVKSIDGKIYVKNDRDGVIHQGMEIVSINGISAQELWSKVSDVGVYEGNSTVGYMRITDALFPSLLGMVTEVKKENVLELKNPISGEVSEVTVPGYKMKELRKKSKKNKFKPYDFWVDHDFSLGYIQIKTFGHNKRPKYYKFLRQSYNRILSSGVENLVVDLRGNTGGLINRAEMLLSMYSDSTVHLPKNMISSQSRVSLDYYDKKYKGLNRWFINHFYKKNEKISSYRKIMNMEVGEIDTLYFDEDIADYFPKFKGNTFVLMDGLSGSASVLFLAVFDRNEMGLTLGEPCLGPATGTWGNPTNFKLDNSGLNVLLSIIRTNTDNTFETQSEPILPDVMISTSPEDLYNGTDREMDFVKNLINE